MNWLTQKSDKSDSDVEKKIEEFFFDNSREIKLFLFLFLITVIIYGGKLFFNSLATDDFGRFYSKGSQQASWLGRWMAGIINEYIFTGLLQILPYFNGILGVFSFTLSGFLTAKFFNRKNVIEISIITLLIAVTPFFAHNFYFNTNVSVWITTLIGVIGLVLAYRRNKLLKLLGFLFLVITIGTYQAIIQVAVAMVTLKAIIDIIESKNIQEVKKIIFEAFLYIGFIFLAFIVSNIINILYMEYYHLKSCCRYKNSLHIVNLHTYIERIISIYKRAYELSFGLLYFRNQFALLYKATIIATVLGIIFFIIKNNDNKEMKVVSILLSGILLSFIPLIINLPLITGNGIPTRAYYVIGWIISGFFAIQVISYRGVFKAISFLLAVSIIILSSYYINVFYYAANRQTIADIIRANQIVNRIRVNTNYRTEPIELRVVGRKSFSVVGWRSAQQALNTLRSKYAVFKNFTDLRFTVMSDKDYKEMIKYIVQKYKKVNSYPGKNSIIVYNNKVLLILNPEEINRDIAIYRFMYELKDKKPDIISKFDLYITSKGLYYFKKPCTKEDIKATFFLHVYPKDKTKLPPRARKYGFKNMDFRFQYKGIMKDRVCIAYIKLPDYKIEKIETGQFKGRKRYWDVILTVNGNAIGRKK